MQPADAEIVVDGDTWQRTAGVSRLLLELTGGSHRVEVRREGYLPFVSQVTVEPGVMTPLNVSLSPEPGR